MIGLALFCKKIKIKIHFKNMRLSNESVPMLSFPKLL